MGETPRTAGLSDWVAFAPLGLTDKPHDPANARAALLANIGSKFINLAHTAGQAYRRELIGEQEQLTVR
jgi:hypothetical protein